MTSARSAALAVALMLTMASDSSRKPSSAVACADRDLVIVLEHAIAITRVDIAHPNHAEGVELGRAKSAHAGRAENSNAFVERVQDFLVPHRRHQIEEAVDNADRVGTMAAAR